MRKLAGMGFVLVLAMAGLSGCAPQLKKLGYCTSGPYRYANPNGTTLPSLTVPSPDDLNRGAPDPGAGAVPAPTPEPAPAPAPTPEAKPRNDRRAPVAAPPKRGAMLLPNDRTAFGSC